MKTLVIATLIVLLAGCGVELLTTTAIQGELQAQQMTAMKRQLSNAGDQSSRIRIQRAIDTYQAENGFYPSSLNDLVPSHIQSIPTKSDGTEYGYNPTTGRLLDSPMESSGPTRADKQKMQSIALAVDKCSRETGYYPFALNDLVPTYLTHVPKTDSGVAFVYYPEDGSLFHPDELANQMQNAQAYGQQQFAPQQQSARQVPRGGYGAGPMGETMTGIGIQNELNSMNNSGSAAAGSYSRRQLGGTSGTYGDRQSQAMDDLGL